MAGRNLDDIDCEIREVHGRTFRKLGSLLIEIVDRKLFQLKGFSNVEDYFNSEGHLPSARQAFRLISATRFSRQLPASLPQPKSERQVGAGKGRGGGGGKFGAGVKGWRLAVPARGGVQWAVRTQCLLGGGFLAGDPVRHPRARSTDRSLERSACDPRWATALSECPAALSGTRAAPAGLPRPAGP